MKSILYWFPYLQEAVHTLIQQRASKTLGGNCKYRLIVTVWWQTEAQTEIRNERKKSACALPNSADRVYRSDPEHLWDSQSTMRQLKTHLSTDSPYGWMCSGRATLITSVMLLGAQGAACIIISAQTEHWNHKSAEHMQAGLVFSWPCGISHLSDWECLSAYRTVNVSAWKDGLRRDKLGVSICLCVRKTFCGKLVQVQPSHYFSFLNSIMIDKLQYSRLTDYSRCFQQFATVSGWMMFPLSGVQRFAAAFRDMPALLWRLCQGWNQYICSENWLRQIFM